MLRPPSPSLEARHRRLGRAKQLVDEALGVLLDGDVREDAVSRLSLAWVAIEAAHSRLSRLLFFPGEPE